MIVETIVCFYSPYKNNHKETTSFKEKASGIKEKTVGSCTEPANVC